MEQSAINKEECEKLESQWTNMADWYAKNIEVASTQGMVTCAVMANMPQCKRVIEVACGPGVHSKILATSFLNRDGGVQVSCDYSGGMVKKLKETFEQDGDYTLAPGNKFLMDSDTDYNEFVEGSTSELKNKCDLDKIVGEQGTFNKFVYGCQANNEVLPFPSDYFEAYLAPLSLMLVNSHKNMISEAYRVTKSGSRSVFTIWGNEEKSLMFTLAKVIVRRYVPDYEANHISSNFDLWRDKGAQLKIDLESAGFVSIKMWEQPMNVFVGQTGEDYMKQMGEGSLKFMMKDSGMGLDKFDDLRKEAIEYWDAQTGKDTTDFKTWENVIVMAFKK